MKNETKRRSLRQEKTAIRQKNNMKIRTILCFI